MTTYRGQDGFVSLGGYVAGYPSTATGVPEGGTQVTILGPQLTGVLLPGDTFTLHGIDGTYTVQGLVVAVNNQFVNVPFSPPAPVGGFPLARFVVFASHSIAQTRTWTVTPTLQVLETTVQRAAYRTRRTGLTEWEGTFEGLFDYGDPSQAALLNKFIASAGTGGKPDGTTIGLSFTVSAEGPVILYGAAVLTTLVIASPGQELVTITGTFQSTGGDLVLGTPGTLGATPIVPPGSSTFPVRYLEPFDLERAPLPVAYTEPFDPAAQPALTVRYTEPFDAA